MFSWIVVDMKKINCTLYLKEFGLVLFHVSNVWINGQKLPTRNTRYVQQRCSFFGDLRFLKDILPKKQRFGIKNLNKFENILTLRQSIIVINKITIKYNCQYFKQFFVEKVNRLGLNLIFSVFSKKLYCTYSA